jgi:hypothetical protein
MELSAAWRIASLRRSDGGHMQQAATKRNSGESCMINSDAKRPPESSGGPIAARLRIIIAKQYARNIRWILADFEIRPS